MGSGWSHCLCGGGDIGIEPRVWFVSRTGGAPYSDGRSYGRPFFVLLLELPPVPDTLASRNQAEATSLGFTSLYFLASSAALRVAIFFLPKGSGERGRRYLAAQAPRGSSQKQADAQMPAKPQFCFLVHYLLICFLLVFGMMPGFFSSLFSAEVGFRMARYSCNNLVRCFKKKVKGGKKDGMKRNDKEKTVNYVLV